MAEVNESMNAAPKNSEEVQIHVTGEPSRAEQSNIEQTNTKTRSAFTDVLQAIYKYWLRHSHFSALIIMLAWSITYHSWLTFLLLLAACIIWMTPQKSKLLLTLSPIIVFYGICLVLLQYIYGLQLNDNELPVKTSTDYPLSELGLVKYKEKSCLALAVKLLFTLGFFFTMRQWSYERKLKNDAEALTNLSLRLVESGAREYFLLKFYSHQKKIQTIFLMKSIKFKFFRCVPLRSILTNRFVTILRFSVDNSSSNAAITMAKETVKYRPS